jgi:hypothetical protein
VYSVYHHGERESFVTGKERKLLILKEKRPDLYELFGDRAIDEWDEYMEPDAEVHAAPSPVKIRFKATTAADNISQIVRDKVDKLTRANMNTVLPFRTPQSQSLVGITKGTVKLSPLWRKDFVQKPGSPPKAVEEQPFAFKPPAWLSELD